MIAYWLGQFFVKLYLKLWQLHVYLVQNIFDWVRTGWVWWVAIIGIVIGIIMRIVYSMGDAVVWLVTSMTAIFNGMPIGLVIQMGFIDVLAVGNYLVSLEEGFAFIVYLSGFKLLCVTLRIVKLLILIFL